MNEVNAKPVIFLAFAQDREHKVGYLRNLPTELDGIRKALQKARQADLCEVVERANTTIDNIIDVFQEYQDRVAIFHYGGHAGSYELLLESASGTHQLAHSEGLVSFLVKQKGLQLVFLNGCSSQQQAFDLLAAGVPAVVGTSQKIADDVATSLSVRFYSAFAQGATIERAWAEAVDQVKIEKGSNNFRDLFGDDSAGDQIADRFPWEIYFREGAEVVKDWNLPEAVENPLFGLPPIPKTHILPETPFLFLRRYEREHAEIFFGRSYYIRELYNRVSDANAPPIILLYGQSGVGKSSLFDAGLNPRLESDYKVIYIRRNQDKGLHGTLRFALEQEAAKHEEHSPTISAETNPSSPFETQPNRETLRFLEEAARNANDRLKNEIENLIERIEAFRLSEDLQVQSAKKQAPSAPQQMTDNSLLAHWLFVESQSGKPLIIILDQVEELYTRPNRELPDELADFLVALRGVFGSQAQRPRGKLILGYRKEYHPEIEEDFKIFLLPRSNVFLEPLRRKDILEVFRGVSKTAALKQFYNLSIEDDLPVIIADDLLEDKESPVAPVLQIVLTKMWNAAKQQNPQAPRFTVEQYQQLKKDGIAMGEFFAQQMRQLRHWNADAVDSGLALDVLHFHITALGTAGARSLKELRETYQHRQDILDTLVGKCKELYLLTEAQHSADFTSLTHDTLAPVVNNEYNNSDKPGQRASRILKSKMADFSENGSDVWLDEADLALVEQGDKGMHRLSEQEESLLAQSREKRRQRQRLRKQLWAGGIVMLIGIVASAVLAFVKMQEAELEARRAKSQFLTIKANEVATTDITCAMRIAQAAYALFEEDPPIPSIQALSRIYDRRNDESFYEKKFRHGDGVNSAVFSPDGQQILTASSDKTARLWSLAGETVTKFTHDAHVTSAVFSPNDDKILSASWDGTARLWSLAGDSLAVFKHDGDIYSAFFSPDGQMILTNSSDYTARLWSLSGDSLAIFNHAGYVLSAVFSPDGQIILTASSDKTAQLWSLAGNSLTVFKHDDYVTSAVFSPNGDKILTASRDLTARLWSLTSEPLAVFKHDDYVNSAVFSPDGQTILTASNDKTARLWSLTGDSLAVFTHDETVISAGYFPDGQKILTASSDKTARLWSLEGASLAVFKHDREVSSAVFSPDGQKILTASWDETARLWSLATHSLANFEHNDEVTSAVFSPDGQKILTASWDKTARLWSLAGESQAVYPHENKVTSAVFSPNGQQVLTASEFSPAWLWSLAGDFLPVFKHSGYDYSAVFSPDGGKILTASSDFTAKLWSLTSDSLAVFEHNDEVTSAVFSPDGRKILTVSKDGNVRLWSLAGDLLSEFTHENVITTAVFSPDGDKILTASRDYTAKLWSLTGDSLAVFKHEGYVHFAVFSPDGQMILTESWDWTPRLWSLTGASLAVFKHDSYVNSAVVSPDGQKILTASTDGAARLWRTPKGIYEWLKTANIYQLSEQERREYGIIDQ